MTPGDKFKRSLISGGIGIGGGYFVGIAVAAIFGSNPPGWLVIGAGFFVGLFVENPVSNAINERFYPAERNLKTFGVIYGRDYYFSNSGRSSDDRNPS